MLTSGFECVTSDSAALIQRFQTAPALTKPLANQIVSVVCRFVRAELWCADPQRACWPPGGFVENQIRAKESTMLGFTVGGGESSCFSTSRPPAPSAKPSQVRWLTWTTATPDYLQNYEIMLEAKNFCGASCTVSSFNKPPTTTTVIHPCGGKDGAQLPIITFHQHSVNECSITHPTITHERLKPSSLCGNPST